MTYIYSYFKKAFVLALSSSFLLGFSVSAANYVPPKNVKVADVASQSISITWESGGGDGTNYLLTRSTNGVDYTFVALVPNNITSYTFTGLSANTRYRLAVSSGDGVGQTSASTVAGPVYTGAYTPHAPLVSNLMQTSVDLTIDVSDGNPDTVSYDIREIKQTGSFVQADGTLGANYFVTSAVGWGTKTVKGLQPNTEYVFVVVAKNNEDSNTASSPKASVLTPAVVKPYINTPAPAVLKNPTMTTMDFSLRNRENPLTTPYAVRVMSGLYVQTDGSLGTVMVMNTIAGWGTKTVKGLIPNTRYTFEVMTQDGSGTQLLTSVPTSLSTAAAVPSSVFATLDPTGNMVVSWMGNGSLHFVENMTNKTSSGWITDSSFTFTQLKCGTPYVFRVKAKNEDGFETAFSPTVTALSKKCDKVVSVPVTGISTTSSGSIFTPPTDLPPAVKAEEEKKVVSYADSLATSTRSSASFSWAWLLLPLIALVGIILLFIGFLKKK